MDRVRENVIEWITGSDTITVTASDRAFITKMKQIMDKYPEEVKYFIENPDGSILVKISKYCLQINAKKKINMSEERKQQLRERFSDVRRKAKEGE